MGVILLYVRYTHAYVPSLYFFGVRIPSLTAVPYAIWFGDPRLRKRELQAFLSVFFFFLMVSDGLTADTHTVYQ